MKKLRVLFICQSIDKSDPIVGDTVDRVRCFSSVEKVEILDVLAIKGKVTDKIEKGRAISLERENFGRIRTLINFYSTLIPLFKNNKYDYVYLYMVPTLANLLLPMKIFFNFKIATWFAHTIFRPLTRIALQCSSDLWFSVDVGQSGISHKHKYLVGQGVNTKEFFPVSGVPKKWDLITLGRVTPQKKIEKIIQAIAYCRDHFGLTPSLAIAGAPYIESDHTYKKQLENLISDLQLNKYVHFLGAVSRENVPDELRSSRLFVFPVPGGIGKAAMESLACGTPILVSYLPSKSFLGEELSEYMICEDSIRAMGESIVRILKLNNTEEKKLLKSIEIFSSSNLSMSSLFQRIVDNMQQVMINEK